MTEPKQPEAMRLAGLLELAPEDGVEPQAVEDAAAELRRLHAENESLRAERERILHSIRVSNEIINEKNDELESLSTGYAAARLEIESLRARSAAPAGEYPLLPEPVGKVEVSTTLENSGLRRHKASPAYTSDQRRAYVDRAMRAEQPTGAQAAPAAVAGPDCAGKDQPITQSDIDTAREKIMACRASALLSGGEGEARTVFDERHLIYSLLGDAWCHLVGEISAPTTQPAPQQEAQEPVMIYHGDCTIDCGEHGHHHVELLRMIPVGSKLYTAPQPSPASQGDALDAARYRYLTRSMGDYCITHAVDLGGVLKAAAADAAIDAARAAQEGKSHGK